MNDTAQYLGLVTALVGLVAWFVRLEQRGHHTAKATEAAQKTADDAKAKAAEAEALAKSAASDAKGGFLLLDERLKAMGSALTRVEALLQALMTKGGRGR